MTSREFVVHGYLREAAAGGCPRGWFYAGAHRGRFPVIGGFLGKGGIGDTDMPRKARGGGVKKAGHPTRRVRYSVAMSLDGFIAGPNGEADWIIMDPSSEAPIDFKAMYSRFGTIVMGRRTYEVAKAAGGGGSTPDMQVFVFSRTLRCGPTAHRYYSTDSASFRFRRPGPTAHRSIWRRHRASHTKCRLHIRGGITCGASARARTGRRTPGP